MSADQVAGLLLLDIAIVIAVGRLLAAPLRALGQPPVLGEIIGGIALGPSLLGALPGDPSSVLFPDEVRGGLAAIGSVGIVLFMFLVGLELDLRAVRRYERVVATVSAGSVLLPFALGIGLAAVLHGRHGDGVAFVPFALFIATALSITAFPVLARILMDRDWQDTRLGVLATASAAVQDGVGWILLTVSLVALEAKGWLPLGAVLAQTAALAGFVLLVVRPLLQRLAPRLSADEGLRGSGIAVAVVGLAACAAATQLIGLHSVLGAFFFGAVFPRRENPELVTGLSRSLRPATMGVLLPIFFLTPGLNVDLTGLGWSAGLELLLIFACACAGKLVGTTVAARLAGLRGPDAHRLAALMNARGLIELIVLNVGLAAGVLSVALFSELVVVAVVTTMMAGPLLDLIGSRTRHPPSADPVPA